MMEPEISELAERLGGAMAASQAARTFKQRRADSMADKDTQALLKAYQEHLDLIARKEDGHQAIEVPDKHKLQDLQAKVFANERLKALMAAQADYVELIQQVNDILGRHLVTAEGPAPKVQPA